MNINFNKTSHIIFFGGIIPFLSWFISQWFFNIFHTWPNWLEGPSPLVVYGIIFFIFDKYLWRWHIFSKFGIVWFPNLNGRWKGTQQSSHQKNGKGVQIDGRLEVSQSFSKICIRAYYPRSESESVAASFSEFNDEVYLFYTYDNEPTSLKTGTMQKHKGSGKIKLLPKNILKGCYWNSIGNYGEMEYKFDQKELFGQFNE